ncbi:hypothetical protein ACHAWF_006197 [Thalassiosira exigua]
MIAILLHNLSSSSFKAKFVVMIRDASGKNIFRERKETDEYTTFQGTNACGWVDYIKRSRILDPSRKILNHGTLTVEVRIKLHDDHRCVNFIPKNEFARNMTAAYMDKDTADVVFAVGSHLFYAHKVVLQCCAKGSTLASLCEVCDKSSPVHLVDIDPRVFHNIMYYVYGGIIKASDWKDRSKDLIDAADKFGLTNLKIEAEAWYVKHLDLMVDNVIDNLVYADMKNCFLLKEVAMDFTLKNGKEVLASESFEDMPESKSITREIISVAMRHLRSDDKREDSKLEDLSINELRSMLHSRGQDFDGSRKRLISQLQISDVQMNKKPKTSG